MPLPKSMLAAGKTPIQPTVEIPIDPSTDIKPAKTVRSDDDPRAAPSISNPISKNWRDSVTHDSDQ